MSWLVGSASERRGFALPTTRTTNNSVKTPFQGSIPLVECLILRFSGGAVYPCGTYVPTITVDAKAIPHYVLKPYRH
jgi:hypothetical protein